MGRIFINSISQAEIQAAVQAELAANPPGSQLPSYATAPNTTIDGDMYRNTTDGKVYMMNNNTWKLVDISVDNYSKTLGNGTSFTILASEHKLESVSGIQLYDTNDREVGTEYSVNIGLTVNIFSEINLNNYKLKIFS